MRSVHAYTRACVRACERSGHGISVGQSRVKVRIQRTPHDNARDIRARLDWPNAPLRLSCPRFEFMDEGPRNEIKEIKNTVKAAQFIYRFVNLYL